MARPTCDVGRSFDATDGWGLFDCSLYHANKAVVSAYGTCIEGITDGSRFSNGDIIGVLVDRVNGRLLFYKNGISLGLAFEDKCLCEG